MRRRTFWRCVPAVAITATVAALALTPSLPVATGPADRLIAAPVLERSALESYPGFRRINYRDDEAQYDREERAREGLTAACMQRLGRRYVPSPSKRYESFDVAGPAGGSPDNANDVHVDAMDPADRRTYFLALYGVPDPFAENTAGTTPTSCVGQAFSTVPSLFTMSRDLRDARDTLPVKARRLPPVVEAERGWSRCMRAAGHPYTTVEEMLRATDEARPRTAAGTKGEDARLRHDRDCGPALGAATERALLRLENDFAVEHRLQLDAHRARVAAIEPIVAQHQ